LQEILGKTKLASLLEEIKRAKESTWIVSWLLFASHNWGKNRVTAHACTSRMESWEINLFCFFLEKHTYGSELCSFFFFGKNVFIRKQLVEEFEFLNRLV